MTRKKKCNSESNSFLAGRNKYVFSLFLNISTQQHPYMKVLFIQESGLVITVLL